MANAPPFNAVLFINLQFPECEYAEYSVTKTAPPSDIAILSLNRQCAECE